jgi:hypothetical protein
MLLAAEARYLMGEDDNSDATSTRSSRRAAMEIAIGVKEEAGVLSKHARQRFALKRRFDPNAPTPFRGRSLFILSTKNKFRQRLYRIVNKKRFDYFMFAVIFANCGFMVYESPKVVPGTRGYDILKYSDYAFTAVFTIEALMKIVAFNFREYLRKVQNVVDFLIVVISILLIAIESANVSFLKGLRVLRAFKPVRMLTRSAGMQLVMRSLLLSLASIGNVTFLMMIFFM